VEEALIQALMGRPTREPAKISAQTLRKMADEGRGESDYVSKAKAIIELVSGSDTEEE
jgi:hypothetical protein